MKNGGYKIIDLEGRNIDPEAGGHVDGIYAIVEESVGGTKPTLVSGVKEDGNDIEAFFTKFETREGIFYGLISLDNSTAKYLKIEDDDDVSIVTETLGGGSPSPSTDLQVLAMGNTIIDKAVNLSDGNITLDETDIPDLGYLYEVLNSFNFDLPIFVQTKGISVNYEGFNWFNCWGCLPVTNIYRQNTVGSNYIGFTLLATDRGLTEPMIVHIRMDKTSSDDYILEMFFKEVTA